MTTPTTDDRDRGVTLVELIVYIAVGALFASLLASLFVSGLKSQAQTRDRDIATGKAQVVTDMLQKSVRNAQALQVDGSVLRARVATGASGWECRAWALTPAGTVVYTTSASAIAPSPTSSWTTLIGPDDGQQGAAVNVAGTLASDRPFALNGTRLDYGFTVSVGTATVPVTGSIVAQARPDGAGSQC
jgi:type II secretory pathway pseudopilin PulG